MAHLLEVLGLLPLKIEPANECPGPSGDDRRLRLVEAHGQLRRRAHSARGGCQPQRQPVAQQPSLTTQHTQRQHMIMMHTWPWHCTHLIGSASVARTTVTTVSSAAPSFRAKTGASSKNWPGSLKKFWRADREGKDGSGGKEAGPQQGQGSSVAAEAEEAAGGD